MKKTLQPFSRPPLPLTISVEVQCTPILFIFDFYLVGSVNAVSLLDQSATTLSRAEELWNSTCFEWFLKSKNHKNYWEFNGAPTGHWNFYELEGYRTNLLESTLVDQPVISCNRGTTDSIANSYSYHVEIPAERLLTNAQINFDEGVLAISSVVKWQSGETSYFSLNHANDKPDFHSEAGFILSLRETHP
jgi:hypothetical protein